MSHRSIARRTYIVRPTLKGWTVVLNEAEVLHTWSRSAAEEAAMEAALGDERAGRPVAVVALGLDGHMRTIARGRLAIPRKDLDEFLGVGAVAFDQPRRESRHAA